MCLTSVTYQVCVNGELTEVIVLGRGLRQGDLLSPYLFILCAEGLSTLMRRAELRGDIYGVRVARGAPSVAHLLFADDCYLFFKASNRGGEAMKLLLQHYEAASGQEINFDKSELFFSVNTPTETRNNIKALLGVVEGEGGGSYLDAPSLIGNIKEQYFGTSKTGYGRASNHGMGDGY